MWRRVFHTGYLLKVIEIMLVPYLTNQIKETKNLANGPGLNFQFWLIRNQLQSQRILITEQTLGRMCWLILVHNTTYRLGFRIICNCLNSTLEGWHY
jgi:hypothetical protein